MPIAHITNFPSREIVDGGSQREEALAAFLASRGAERLVVQDKGFAGSRSARLWRASRLIRELRDRKPELVVLNYPSYPFYWRHKVTVYLLMSLMFSARLRRLANRLGFGIVIDVMDLPAFQHEDLGYRTEMRDSTLNRSDRFVFSRADALWVCSESIAGLIGERYGIEASRLIIALNGHDMGFEPPPADDSGPLKLAYAGSLNRERGIARAIEAFMASGVEDAELHLCGPFGQWIGEEYSDRRLALHGALTDAQASRVLAGCHVGLVPYPETGYYNLAFATKLPFYLALGLPVLSSEATETASHVRRLGVGLVQPIDDFAAAIAHLARDRGQIAAWREQVLSVRGGFAWSSIYSQALAATSEGANR